MNRPKNNPCDRVGGNVRRCLCSAVYVIAMLPIVAPALLFTGAALAIEWATHLPAHGQHAPVAQELDPGNA